MITFNCSQQVVMWHLKKSDLQLIIIAANETSVCWLAGKSPYNWRNNGSVLLYSIFYQLKAHTNMF